MNFWNTFLPTKQVLCLSKGAEILRKPVNYIKKEEPMARLSIKTTSNLVSLQKPAFAPSLSHLKLPRKASIMYVREETLVLPILVLDLLSSSGRH